MQSFFKSQLGMVVCAVTATFLWGSAFPFIKKSYVALDIAPHEWGEQLLFAGYRFFLSGIMIFLFYGIFRRGSMKYKKNSFSTVLQVGLLMTFLQYVFFYIGLSHSTGIQGSIMAGTATFFQVILAHYLLKNDALTVRKAIGLIIGFSGVILTYLPKGELQLVLGIGEICILTSAFIASYGNIVTKRALSHYTPHYLSGYGMIIGSSILIVIGAGNVGFQTLSFGSSEWFMLLYLSFLSAAGFILWNNIMRYHAVGKVSLFMFLVPIFGVILSSILLNEQLYVLTLVGLLLVTVGIIVVNAQFTAWKQLKKRSDIA